MTKTSGRHNYKFGGLYRYNMVDSAGANLPRGSLSFTRDITGIPDAFAAFLIGIPISSNSAEGAPQAFIRQSKVGLYVLDDYKVNNRLSLNIGLRWDWFGPVTDAQGRIRNLSFEGNDIKSINGFTAPMLVPSPDVREQLYRINWKQFMPRLGVAYRLFPGAAANVRKAERGVVAHLEHWPSNPLSLGSYTCYLPGQFTTIAGNEAKPVDNIFFAGEHTNSFYEWQGFMEGALLSGIAAAASLLRAK